MFNTNSPTQEEALSLEQHLVDRKDWMSVPKEALEISSRGDASYGIGKHPEKGWFVLATQGQGPVIAWTEW